MRYSQFLITTLRDNPAEAEVMSHRLMVRSGMIRKLAAGIYSVLPLGQRVLHKTISIIREEMNRAGALEITLPIVQPAELWLESKRWNAYGKELLRFKDRHDRNFCLGPTHEEVITDLVRNTISSYRQLPLNLYQIHTKFRDEIRPRFGVMRAREFLMKDAYSFDRDEENAERSYQKMYQAYCAIFTRLGLTFRAVEADTGPIGGSFSHEFMVLAETGEDTIVSCTACDYAANLEKAEIGNEVFARNTTSKKRMQRVHTPGKKTVEEVSRFLGVPPSTLIKTLIFETPEGPIAALVRGDHDVNETKLKSILKCAEIFLADEDRIQELTNAPRGFTGPLGLSGIRIIADNALRSGTDYVIGGNEQDVHIMHVCPDIDFHVDIFCDIRCARDGDPCRRCGARLKTSRGIEVGHIFKLGTKYSEAMHATFLDEKGRELPFVMGCYGIGVGRTVAAAIEQLHDEHGIIFPQSIAPFDLVIVPVNSKDAIQMRIAEDLYHEAQRAAIDVILDDRDERPGSKFADADLIGIPVRLTVGKYAVSDKSIDIKVRKTGAVHKVTVDNAIPFVIQQLNAERL
ncbi:MAG: proline--tRNA ligase [Desulfobacterota bacterium]|nr:proline--tRNA ligase [Thermodesulfobacteriota bacterium]